MKKTLLGMALALLLLWMPTAVQADGDPFACDTTIPMAAGQQEAALTLWVENDGPYAGAEFGLQCGQGVTIEKVTYDQAGLSAAGPTEARGLTWFSFFAGDNRFEGRVTATVTLRYTGEENINIMVQYVSLYKKDGVRIDEELLTPKTNILISRDGDPTPVPPVSLPDDAKPQPDPGSSDLSGPSANTGGSGQGNSPSSPAGAASGAVSGTAAETSHTTNTTASAHSEPSVPIGGQNASQASADNSSSSVYMTADTTSEQKVQSINWILAICLGASVLLNLLLGCFIIKQKLYRKTKKEGSVHEA